MPIAVKVFETEARWKAVVEVIESLFTRGLRNPAYFSKMTSPFFATRIHPLKGLRLNTLSTKPVTCTWYCLNSFAERAGVVATAGVTIPSEEGVGVFACPLQLYNHITRTTSGR